MADNGINVKVGFTPQTKELDTVLKRIQDTKAVDVEVGVDEKQFIRFSETLKRGMDTTVRIHVDSSELDELARSKNLEFNVQYKTPEQALTNAAKKNLDEYKKRLIDLGKESEKLHKEIAYAFEGGESKTELEGRLTDYRNTISDLLVLTKKFEMANPDMPSFDISSYTKRYKKLVESVAEEYDGLDEFDFSNIGTNGIPNTLQTMYYELADMELNPKLISDLSTTITKLEDIKNLSEAFNIDLNAEYFDFSDVNKLDTYRKQLEDIYKSFTPVNLIAKSPEKASTEVNTPIINSGASIESVPIEKGVIEKLETNEMAVKELSDYITEHLDTIIIEHAEITSSVLDELHTKINEGLNTRFLNNPITISSIKPQEGVLDAFVASVTDRVKGGLSDELSKATSDGVKDATNKITLESNAKSLSAELNTIVDEINKKLEKVTIKKIEFGKNAISDFKKKIKAALADEPIVLENIQLSDNVQNSLAKIDGSNSKIDVALNATTESIDALKRQIYNAISSISIDDLSISPETVTSIRSQIEEGLSYLDISFNKEFSLDAVESSISKVKDKIRELYDVSDSTKYTKDLDNTLANRINKAKDKLIASGDTNALSEFNRAIANSNSKESFNEILQITKNIGSNIGGEFYTATRAAEDYATALSTLNNSDKLFVDNPIKEWVINFSKAISETPIEHFNVDVAVENLAESIAKVLSSTSLEFQDTIAKAVAEAKTVAPSLQKKASSTAKDDTSEVPIETINSLQGKISQKINSIRSSQSKLNKVDISLLSEDDIKVIDKYEKHLETLKNLFNSIRRENISKKEVQSATQEFNKVQSDLYDLSIREGDIISKGSSRKSAKKESSDDDMVGDTSINRFQDLLSKRIRNVQNTISRLQKVDISLFSEEDINMVDQYTQHLQALKQLFDKIQQGDLTNGEFKGMTEEYSSIQSSLYELGVRENEIVIQSKFDKTLNTQSKAAIDLNTKIQTLLRTMSAYHRNNSKAFKNPDNEAEYQEIFNGLQADGLNDKQVKTFNNQYKTLTSRIEILGQTGKTAGERIGEMFQKFGGWTLVTKSLMKVAQIMRQVVTAVHEVDAAMTDLKKVTNATSSELESYFKRVGDTAYQIGSSMSDLISATASFSRLGYSLDEAEELGKLATVYKSVAEDLDITEASNSIISTLKAFEKTKVTAQEIVDLFNYVGNNFAISSAGIGEALQNSAASLYAANNTLEQSVALVTAANTVVNLCHAFIVI